MIVPFLTGELTLLGDLGWKNALFFYIGLFGMAAALVSIFPTEREMVQRQKDLEEDMQENLSINLTI